MLTKTIKNFGIFLPKNFIPPLTHHHPPSHPQKFNSKITDSDFLLLKLLFIPPPLPP